jgi:transcription elongation GreA/GreB family factor
MEPKRDRMTQAQHDRLAEELAELEGPRRAEVVQAIKVARELRVPRGEERAGAARGADQNAPQSASARGDRR